MAFEVEDTAIGIDSEDLSIIFSPFEQGKAGKQLMQGTGLGLAVCQKIVQHHDGTITAESSPGKGSRFIITFPANRVKSKILQTA